MAGLKRTVAPTGYPITDAEVREHARIDHEAEADVITRAIAAAVEYVERETRRQLLAATYVLALDRFPCRAIALPKPPLIEVSSIVYFDSNGTEITLTASTDYQVDDYAEPAVIVPGLTNTNWPNTQSGRINAVLVTYRAGWATSELMPNDIRQALLLLAAHWYEHREAVPDRVLTEDMAYAVKSLLSPWLMPEVY